VKISLRALATETSSQGKIFGLNGDTFSMDGSQVGVLKERNEVSLGGFLQSHYGGGLEAEIRFKVLSDFTDKPLEGKLSDKELSGLLVTPDFTKSDGTRTESVRLLHSSSGSLSSLPGGLGCELFTRSFTSGRFASSLLGASHFTALIASFVKCGGGVCVREGGGKEERNNESSGG